MEAHKRRKDMTLLERLKRKLLRYLRHEGAVGAGSPESVSERLF